MASPPAKYPEQMITMVSKETRERIERIAGPPREPGSRSLSEVQREAIERGLEYLEAREAVRR